jgi:hypothetical protein
MANLRMRPRGGQLSVVLQQRTSFTARVLPIGRREPLLGRWMIFPLAPAHIVFQLAGVQE